jgi:hypothetical protein
MLSIFVAIIARCAILVAVAFILTRTVPSMPQSKVYRFVLSFALFAPLNVVINYVNVWTLGYHKMGWTETFIFALLFAAWLTFLPPSQPHNSNTP